MFQQLQEQQAKRINDLKASIGAATRQLDELYLLQKYWPEFAPAPIKCFRQKDEWWLTLKVADLNEALVLAEKMNPETLYMVHDGWQRFTPRCKLDETTYPVVTEKLRGKCSRMLGAPWFFKLEGITKEKSLLFWRIVGGEVCRIEVEIENAPDLYMTADMKTWRDRSKYSNAKTVDHSGTFNRSWIPPTGSDDNMPTGYLYVG